MTPEETLPTETTEPAQPNGCANCGHPVIEPGFKTPLCSTCRQTFIKYPIPKGILLFAGAVGLILIFALFRTTQNVSAGIHFLRGKRAVKSANYNTAEKEFTLVHKQMPGYDEGKEYLAIASFYNQNLDTFMSLAVQLIGKNVEDEDLYMQLDGLMNKAGNYLPSDSFRSRFSEYKNFDSIPIEKLHAFIKEFPDDMYAPVRYISLVYDDTTKLNECDTLLSGILHHDEIQFQGLLYKASIKRQLKQFDSAIYYADRMIGINKESIYGMASKSRAYLLQKKDKEGFDWAMKGYKVDPESDYAKATLALAYHCMNKTKERDEMIANDKSDTTSAMQYVRDVVAGKEKFRDN